MRTSDWLKAVGVALIIMLLDLAIATVVITFYVSAIDPGHPQDYYVKLAPSIATPSTAIVGPVLMFVATWWLGRLRSLANSTFSLITRPSNNISPTWRISVKSNGIEPSRQISMAIFT